LKTESKKSGVDQAHQEKDNLGREYQIGVQEKGGKRLSEAWREIAASIAPGWGREKTECQGKRSTLSEGNIENWKKGQDPTQQKKRGANVINYSSLALSDQK